MRQNHLLNEIGSFVRFKYKACIKADVLRLGFMKR